jgi:hypothetical protein
MRGTIHADVSGSMVDLAEARSARNFQEGIARNANVPIARAWEPSAGGIKERVRRVRRIEANQI